MNLAELQTAVIELTNRPDRVDMTLNAVKSATLKAHQSDYYTRDIFETGVQFDENLFEQDFEVKTFIPLFRAVKYARVYDLANETPMQFFTIITPENALDSYRVARTDVVYLGGTGLHFKCSIQYQYMLFGCYVSPDTTTDGFTSWIAEDHPNAIVYEAAAMVSRATGAQDKFAAFRGLVQEEYRNLMLNNIQAYGY